MSVFKVQLTNTAQGLLDTAGQASGVSVQRTMFAPGPDRITRKLVDGATFTDVNYWKRFAYPQVPLDQAFISVLTDDGAPFTDVPAENVFAKTYSLTLTQGTTYTDNVADVLGDTGGYAVFSQITPTVNCSMRINGDVNAIMSLTANTTQIFNPGDLTISKLEFDNSASGATTGSVAILFSVRLVSAS